MICPSCGERMIGDGYAEPVRCPNVDWSVWFDREPDGRPLTCQDAEEEE